VTAPLGYPIAPTVILQGPVRLRRIHSAGHDNPLP